MTFGIDRDHDPRRAQLARRLAAMAERGSEWRARREAPAAATDGELEAIWGAASLLHQVEEHALDFGAAVIEERVYTPWSHARAMLELSARAWWLVEPDIGAEATLQRTIAVRIDTWGKMHKAYRAMGFDTVNSIADQLRSERDRAVEAEPRRGSRQRRT